MLRKILLITFGILIAGFLFIQILPYGRDHNNPPVVSEPQWDSPTTRELFARACADCHSHETVWPWYSNIAPISWLVQRDIDEGRAKFNVSMWGVSEENEADDAAELTQNGEMPPFQYLPTHPQARFSAQEKQSLVNGLIATFGGEGEAESGEDD